MNKLIFIFGSLLLFFCCVKKTAKDDPATVDVKAKRTIPSPVFNADSAYCFVDNQVRFGPRIPNTETHKACIRHLSYELERFGADIYVQEAFLTAYNGDRLQASNIVGIFNPEQTKRVLLFAHWDSRPYSDQDSDVKNHYKPIDGADDGASGAGVLLEIARQIGIHGIEIGVDLIFFDAEDYGVPDFANSNTPDTYCLGSQFWAKNPHVLNYNAEYGILLDMVGSKNATFYKESYSMYYAESIVERVWETAKNIGFGKFFINENRGRVTDDHLYVIKGRSIPCINIINYDQETSHRFGRYWHTQQDTMDNIDRETLKAVGQTILEVIYK